MSKHKFKTEVNQLLHLIIHSLYSNKDIFLRELISNASDAIDKIIYLSISKEEYKGEKVEPKIEISFSQKDKQIVIQDNGIGLSEEDFKENLGTIAKSGTKEFLHKVLEDKKSNNLIGQFGVGFYSAFMVAEKIEVISRKALSKEAYRWTSTGEENFELEEEKDFSIERGTKIILHMRDDAIEYINRYKIESLVKKYSNHIAYPIFLHFTEDVYGEDGKVIGTEDKKEIINEMNALWKKNKSEIKTEEYNDFFKNNFMQMEDPLFYIHTQAEGTLEYSTLFYIPKTPPHDLYYANYESKIKLYVKRVYINDFDKDLLPKWLRFVYGIVDSEDLDLNVSREILQQSRVLETIKNASTKKILSELKRFSEEDTAKYAEFIKVFNRVLKEGLYDYMNSNKNELIALIRFKSSKTDELCSADEYISRMLPDQKYIYYITGQNAESLKRNPILNGITKKGYEVLLMEDDIDDIVMPMIGTYKDKEFKSISKKDTQDGFKDEGFAEKENLNKIAIEKIKQSLGDRVKDVVISPILKEYPAAIVFDENDPTLGMQNIMSVLNQGKEMKEVKPILEINPESKIILKIKETEDKAEIDDLALLLLDQAILNEGGTLKDPTEFTARLNNVLERMI